jgi:predicted Zn-dependent protease with MMP-like domain
MASGSTPQRNIPYPLSSDNVNVQQDMQEMAEVVDNILDEFGLEIEEQTANLNNAIANTIPDLIEELGLETLLGNGLTWGEIKGS